jgi:phospholipid transport system substrate-binding protein
VVTIPKICCRAQVSNFLISCSKLVPGSALKMAKIFVFLVSAILAWAAPAQVRAQVQFTTADAETFVDGLFTRVVTELTVKDIDREERERRFRKILDDSVPIELVAQWTLGRYGPRATDDQRAEFSRLLEDLTIATYTRQFTRFTGDQVKLEFKGATMAAGQDAVVSTLIGGKAEDQKPFTMDWRLKYLEGRFWIFDIAFGGISMGQARRSEVESVVQRNGGQIDPLLDTLRSNLKALSTQ